MNLMQEFSKLMDDMKKNYPGELFTDRMVYADWLAQTYYFVSHSTALLGCSLPYLKNPELRRRFEKHIGEEERHELMAKKDLEKLGYNLEAFPEHISTTAMYHSQYYRVQFEAATSLLGYILFLEGMAVHWAKDVTEKVKPLYPGSIVFLHVHTTEDPHHLVEAIEAINSLPHPEQVAIFRNLRYTAEMYQQILQSVLAKRSQKLKVA